MRSAYSDRNHPHAATSEITHPIPPRAICWSGVMSWRTIVPGKLPQQAASLSLPVVGGALLGIAIVCLFVHPMWGDQSIYLYFAGRLLDGAKLDIRDVVDSNPPLIIWISEIPVALARALGITPQLAMELCLAALLAGVIPWCMRLVGRSAAGASTTFAWWFAVPVFYATAVYPWGLFGEREHLQVLMILPYLIMVAGRLAGVAPTRGEGAAAGLLASIGFSLKPHELLIAMSVEALLAWRARSLRILIRPETVALALGGLAYLVAVLIWAPYYFRKIIPLARETYLEYRRARLPKMIYPKRLLKVVGAIMLGMVARRRLRHEPLVSVFLVAGIAALAAFYIQQKGFEDQILPVMSFLTIMLGVVVIDVLLPLAERCGSLRPPRTVAAAGTLLTAALVGAFYYPTHSAVAATSWITDRVATELKITAELPKGTVIYVLSATPTFIFDMLIRRDLVWGSRFPHLWMLEAVLRAELLHKSRLSRDQADVIAQWTRDAVAEDLRRWHPSVVLVERCNDPTAARCDSLESFRVDVLRWFEEDRAFADAWSGYSLRRSIGPYDLWCANGSEVCDRLVSSR
jgi:hypothetical protein